MRTPPEGDQFDALSVAQSMNVPGSSRLLWLLHGSWGRAMDIQVTRFTGWSPFAWLFQPRPPGKKLEPGLVLQTIHARTGQIRSNVLGTWREPAGTWLVLASNEGGPKNPQWHRNLRGNSSAWIYYRRRHIPVLATELTGGDRQAAIGFVTPNHPMLAAKHLPRAASFGREIPVWRLAGRDTRPPGSITAPKGSRPRPRHP